MSRDFTPKQLYETDKYIANIYGHHLRDAVITRNIDGVEERIDAGKYPDLQKRYPNLMFLFEPLPFLKNIRKEINLKFLDDVEKELTNHLDDTNCQDENSIIQKWYFGKLDNNFYYNYINNEVFSNWLSTNLK